MLKRIARLSLFIFIIISIALLLCQIYLSRSPFISETVVKFTQKTLQQNLSTDISIQIKKGAISLYDLSILLKDIQLGIPDSLGLRGAIEVERLRMKIDPLYLLRGILFIREASLMKPRINLALLEKATKKDRDKGDYSPAHSILPSLLTDSNARKEMLPEGLIVRKLRVKEGTLFISGKNKESSTKLDNLNLSLSWEEDQGLWKGKFLSAQGYIKHEQYAQKIEAIRTAFSISAEGIRFHEFVVNGSEFSLKSKGSLGFEDIPKLDLDMEAAIPLEFLTGISPKVPYLKGHAKITGEIKGTLSDPRLLTKISVPEGQIRKLAFKNLSLDGEMDLKGIKLKDFFVRMFHGQLSVQGEGSFSKGEKGISLAGYRCQLSAEGLELREFLTLFPGKRKLPFTGLIKTDLNIRGQGFNLATVKGNGKIDIDPLRVMEEKMRDKNHKLSFSAAATYSLDGSSVVLKKAYIKGPGLELNGQGVIDTQKNIELKIESRLLSEEYNKFLPFPITGIISLNGNIRGSFDKPLINGQIEAEKLVIRKYPELPYLRANFSWKDNIFSLQQGIAKDGESQLELKGDVILPRRVAELSLSSLTLEQITLEKVHFYLNGFRVERLRDWIAINLPLSGEAVFQGVVNSQKGKWNGKAELKLGPGNIWQQGFKSLRATMMLNPDNLSIKDLTLLLETGLLKGNGTYYFDDTFTAEITSSGLNLTDIVLARDHAPMLTGEIILDIRGGGNIRAPKIIGNINSSDTYLGELPLGKGFLRAELRDKVLQFRGTPLKGADLSGQINLSAGFHSKFSLDLQRFSLVPLIYLGKKELVGQGFKGWAGGSGYVKGNLLYPNSLDGKISLSQMEIVADKYTIKNRSLVRIALQRGIITIDKAVLGTKDAEISVAGEISPSGKQVIHVSGDLDLPILDRYIPAIKIRQGRAKADLEMVNDVQGMKLKGKVKVSEGAVEVPDVNQKFSGVKGEISLEDGIVKIIYLTAKQGRGSLNIQGNLEQERGKLTSLDLTFQGKELKWQYPQEFSTHSNFLLHLKGKASQPLLQGQLEFNKAKYVTKFNIKDFLLKFRKGEDSIPFKFSDSLDLLLDIELLARDKLVFQSNLANLDLKGRLRLTGSMKKPILLGRVDMEKGELRYLAHTFAFTMGRVDFIDPNRLRSYYEFEAQGEVDKYQVKIMSYGTPQQFNLNLYSDPPLSQVDIISLLSVGKTTEEVKAGAISLGSAPSFIANKISQKFTKGLQKTTGLDALEITPILGGSEGERGVEVMTQKALGEDLMVTYKSSTTTISNEQVIEMEYRLTDHISLVGINSREGSSGFEIKFSFTWD